MRKTRVNPTDTASDKIPNSPPKPPNPHTSKDSEVLKSNRDNIGTGPSYSIPSEALTLDDKFKNYLSNMTIYNPARISRGKSAFVECYYFDEAKGKRVRHRKKFNNYPSNEEREFAMRQYVADINMRLRLGRNPFGSKSKDSMTIGQAFTYYRKNYYPEREDSIRTYTSVHSIFLKWCTDNKLINLPVEEFDTAMAVKYLNSLIHQRHINNRTYNNHLIINKTVFNKLKQIKAINENPFDPIGKKKPKRKMRQEIPREILQRIEDDFSLHCDAMNIVMKLIFYSMIRPLEQCKLQVKNVHVEKNIIIIEEAQSKDHDRAAITIPIFLMKQLERHIAGADPEDYIFSNAYTLRPGKLILNPRLLSKKWNSMRKRLDIDMKYQLYSMKDTGAAVLAHAVSPLSLKNQMRHSSLDTTSEYLSKQNMSADKSIESLPEAF